MTDDLILEQITCGTVAGFREVELSMAPPLGLDTHRLAPTFFKSWAAIFEGTETQYGFRGLRAY